MKLKVLIHLCLIGLMFACTASTKLVNVWVDPTLESDPIEPFKKVLVIARIKDGTTNRVAEDKIISTIKTPSLPSYAFLLPSDTNQLVVDEKLKEQGFDGIITMRLMEVNESLNYQQGSGGYYGGGYGGMEDIMVVTMVDALVDIMVIMELQVTTPKTKHFMWKQVLFPSRPTSYCGLEQLLL